ncbi:MAG: 2OG-Fe dioxygenase family protein [Pseudomonadota bacterium]
MGFAHATHDEMFELLQESALAGGWQEFSSSWNNLKRDRYMADGGRYRDRRHGVFSIDRAGVFKQVSHQPHYQSHKFNGLNGGLNRWFDPLETFVSSSTILHSIIDAGCDVFRIWCQIEGQWRIEVHQMRINARGDAPGKPTPEGLHRDGVDYALIMLIAKAGVHGGATTICDLQERTLARLILAEPLETLFLDDRLLKHGVSPVVPVEGKLQPGYRDVLVITWKQSLGPEKVDSDHSF